MMISSDDNGDGDEEDDSKNEYHRVFGYCFSDLPKVYPYFGSTLYIVWTLDLVVSGFYLPVASICQVMLSPNGSEHVLSSCGAQNAAKEHLELGHCIDEPIVHDDKSLGRRSGRMSFSDFLGYFMSYMIEFPMAVALTSVQLPSRMQPKEPWTLPTQVPLRFSLRERHNCHQL